MIFDLAQSEVSSTPTVAPEFKEKFFVARPTASIRSAPNNKAESVASVSLGQEVTSNGDVSKDDEYVDGQFGQLWIRIKTSDGRVGFVPRRELRSSTEQEAWLGWQQRGQLLEELFQRASKSSGPFAQFAGIYCPTLCLEITSWSPDQARELYNYLSFRFLIWFEGMKMYKTSVFDPRKQWTFDIVGPDVPISFGEDAKPGFYGIKNLQTYKVTDHASVTDYVAFTDTKMFYRKENAEHPEQKSNNFGYYVRLAIPKERSNILSNFAKASDTFSEK